MTKKALTAEEILEVEKTEVENQYRQNFKGRLPEPQNTEDQPSIPRNGIALSGGGIRSASFAIGVLQALNNKSLFEANELTILDRVMYLCSVSGGGYTGCALTWYMRRYGYFPFGDKDSYVGTQSLTTEQNAEQAQKDGSDGNNNTQPDDQSKGNLKTRSNDTLSYIRQHGKYLTPPGLNAFALAGSALRSIIHSYLAYTLILSCIFLGLLGIANTPLIDWLTIDLVEDTRQSLINHIADTRQALLNEAESRGQYMSDSKNEVSFLDFSLILIFVSVICFLLMTLVYCFSSFLSWFSRSYVYRVRFQQSFGFLLTLFVTGLLLVILPLAIFLLSGSDLGMNDQSFLGSASLSVIMGVLVSLQQLKKFESSDLKNGFPLVKSLVIVAFVFFLLLISFSIGLAIFETESTICILIFVAATGFVSIFVNINQKSPHKMYRDRLMATFLKAPDEPVDGPVSKRGLEANTSLLSEFNDSRHWAPYQLISCNVILNNARHLKYQGREGDSFILSSKFCGSDATGYMRTTEFDHGRITLATAMSVSGAAANPNTGSHGVGSSTSSLVSFLMTFLGIRLGYWARNPSSMLRWLGEIFIFRWLGKLFRPNYLYPGLYSLLSQGHNESNPVIELSDGGHFDNTGLYELVRRRLAVIILSEAGADPEFTFDDLGNAIERIRVDFGTTILFTKADCDLSGLLPGSTMTGKKSEELFDEKFKLAERGYAIAEINYPKSRDSDAFTGKLIFIKATLTRNLPGDLYAYKASDEKFPNQPTLDQFFDERQFESYRELGYQLTRQFIKRESALVKSL